MRWCSLLLLFSSLAAAQEADSESEEAGLDVPSRLTAPPLAQATAFLPGQDLLALAKPAADGRLYLAGSDGGVDALTLDAVLQQNLTELLKTYQTPYAAVVALEPSTGRVLAMAEHSEVSPGLRGLCTRALYPAASIFKVVTAAALLEAGVSPEETTCTWGGKRGITPAQLEDTQRDTRCLTMAQALGVSANVVFAKLTARFLDPERLKLVARSLHFNAPFHFPVPTDVSKAAIPQETFELSLAGAGFGDVYLSPLHGAALASVAANRGQWHEPVLFEKDVSGEGEQVMSEEVAEKLSAMMEETVTAGTARRIFHERGHGVPDAAGKTGSLADKRPFRDYTWFIGFAPKAAPRIAVAAVVVNDPRWRIRATWLGREAMRLFLTRPAHLLGALEAAHRPQ